jgi:hypothetical protein
VSKSSKKQPERGKSKLQHVKDVPWALLLQVGIVLGRRWRALSSKDRARLARLARESQGRPGNLSAKQRKELRKLVGKLNLKRAGRELVLLKRVRRWRKRR